MSEGRPKPTHPAGSGISGDSNKGKDKDKGSKEKDEVKS